MMTINIDFDTLRDAARRSRDVADRMEGYADAIPGAVTSPLGSLTGGASSYTSTASSLARDKASELRRRASGYRTFATSIETFGSVAREADGHVGKKLSGLVKEREKDLGFWDRVKYGIFKLTNGLLGDGEVGEFLRDIANAARTATEGIKRSMKLVLDWFKHGAGRYVLDALVSVLGAVGAVLAAIASFPVSGIIGGIMAGLAIFVAADKVFDAGSTLIASFVACSEDSTEPGLARYHGSATSYAEFAKRFTHDKGLQDFTSRASSAADVADFITSFGGLFSYKGSILKNGEMVDTTKFAFKKDVVVANLNKQIGRNAATYDSGPLKGLPKRVDGKMQFTFNPKIFDFSDNMSLKDGVSSVKCLTSFTRDSMRIDENFSKGDWWSGIKDVSTLVTSDFMTGIKAPGTVLSTTSLPKKVSTVIGW